MNPIEDLKNSPRSITKILKILNQNALLTSSQRSISDGSLGSSESTESSTSSSIKRSKTCHNLSSFGNSEEQDLKFFMKDFNLFSIEIKPPSLEYDGFKSCDINEKKRSRSNEY